MKFVIASDKFKGSLDGFQFCDAVEEGLLAVMPDAKIVKLPLADGGDGTMEVIRYYLKGDKIIVPVKDPLFREIKASYVFDRITKTAYIEMAEASGLKLLEKVDQNCMNTSTYGTGELILDAISKGATTIILGIGGSSTNDCGIGMASALGYRFLDSNGEVVIPVGKNLSSIATIMTDNVNPNLLNINFKIACDVNNPLYGANGAAKIYAKQKGASDTEVEYLDKGLIHMAELLTVQFGVDLQKEKGAGASGGMGAAALTFLKAELTPGIELVKEIAQLDTQLQDADWIITGEGKLDEQTISGKTIKGVIKSGKNANVSVAAFCGVVDISLKSLETLQISYVCSILKEIVTLDEVIANSYYNLKFATLNFAKLLKVNK
ncbi:glycerate kinase [Aquimarina sp. RZ0]|uniref:glycerate kinase n=1 Tax=Aquimarina sp. RZ0 TaxID=2607730 RepID=UPI0011F36356|nr:glycerate kinase [Aquimarina sp. RZ0]KAA1242440.1 glycerate kinase [Aquimarina sp. RZ0]